MTDTSETTAARASAQWRKDNPALNGFYPLTKGFDAFGARLLLMDRAEKSIDAQYFLMKPDDAGLVFAERMLAAADRGVRVRFLLDDVFTTVKDNALILMDEHPNIEVRIFNPVSRKGIYALNYAGNFKLANRRMHNKAFIVDNELAIVGGRNIAEEYFQLDTTGEFIDFDMLSAGPIVQALSGEFDEYWNHKLAVPMSYFYDEQDKKLEARINEKVTAEMKKSGDTIYGDATTTELMQKLLRGEIEAYLAEARLIADNPNKLLEKVSTDQKLVAAAIAEAMLLAEDEIIVFTPYFIPGKAGLELIREVRAKGVRIVLVTNSLATNNHTSVYSAYSKYRKAVLEAGVELWEARGDAAMTILPDGTKTLEHLTLHTKGIIIDRRYTFVGSLNLDPRSIDINTEMGVIIDSKPMGESLATRSMEGVPGMAYRVKLNDKGKVTWHATIDGKEVIETKAPQTSAWLRFKAWFLKIAPEKQL
jgi:putative cardiolipin synthase